MSHTARKSFVLMISVLVLTVWPSPQAGRPAHPLQNPQLTTSTRAFSLAPDLVAKVVGQEGLLVYPGFLLRNGVKVGISNIGAKDAINFDVDMVLSPTRLLTGKYERLSRLHVPLLKAHASVELPFETGFKIPDDASCKQQYVVAFADSKQTVTEADENNNTAGLAVQVQMKITDVGQYAESPENELELRGLGFGTTPGNKQVCLDASPHLETFYWTPTKIVIHAADVPGCRNYTVTIKQNSATISNAVVLFLKCVIDYSDPKQGQGGTAVHIHGHGFGSAQGGKILKIGTVPVNAITSWAEHDLVCQIPAGLAPGQYFFSVWENGIDVSKIMSINYFTIL